ncbi:MAG TPA: CocE/NonD family hydrolase [Acidimicrobiales bacterium]|nr:CocE/NonD family hydrolase [Acidimicrobiales bacterium]
MEWTGEPVVGRGVVERAFTLDVDGRTVPGIVWTPEGATGTRPLVAIGHGATLHKRVDYVLSLARRFVRHHGYAAVALDAPDHGERGGLSDLLVFIEAMRRPGIVDETVAEWHAAVAAVQQLPEVGTGPLGYWGLSMGTIFGLPYVASEPRVEVAVLGLMGTVGAPEDRLVKDAARVACPVLYFQQWDDELFRRDDVLALFDAVGTRGKRLHVHPGGHSGLPREAYEASEAFVASVLGAPR